MGTAMDDSKKCPKCQTRMETGFIPDFSYGAVLVPRWRTGAPQQRKFLGMTLEHNYKADYREGFPVSAWRCPKCALVELYAPAQTG